MSVWLKIYRVEHIFWPVFWFTFFTSWPQIKHILHQHKTIHGFICIFLEPWLQFGIVGHLNFLFSLEFLSSPASHVLNKRASTKMDQENNIKVYWRFSKIRFWCLWTIKIEVYRSDWKTWSKSSSKIIKCLFNCVEWRFYNSDQKRLSETTQFCSKMHKSYKKFSLQSYPRQHMLAKCYIS